MASDGVSSLEGKKGKIFTPTCETVKILAEHDSITSCVFWFNNESTNSKQHQITVKICNNWTLSL